MTSVFASIALLITYDYEPGILNDVEEQIEESAPVEIILCTVASEC